MRAVWKYAIQPDDFAVDMPRGARILSVGVQQGDAVFWALVDPEAPRAARRMRTVGTGHSHPDEFWQGWRFVGTVGPLHGALWFHLFDGGEPVRELTDVEVTHASIGPGGFGLGGVVKASRETYQVPELELVARAAFRTFEKCGAGVKAPSTPVEESKGLLTFEIPGTPDSGDAPVRIELHLTDLSVHHGMDIAQLLEVEEHGDVGLVDGRTLETFIYDARRRTARMVERARGVFEKASDFEKVKASGRTRDPEAENEAADAGAFSNEWRSYGEDEDSDDLPGDPEIGD
jgi:hypothetical protein